MRHGLRHVYTGNVHDRDGQSTWCHGCGERLVGRDRYRLDVWNLDTHGSCRRCDTPCAGVFEARPGTWGLRRMPVAISADSSV
jgi:pyruvate formate lyase activating enzyme